MFKKENTLWRLIYLSLFLIFVIVVIYFIFLNRENVYCEIYPYYKKKVMSNVEVTIAYRKNLIFLENHHIYQNSNNKIVYIFKKIKGTPILIYAEKDGYFFKNVRVPARDTVLIILHAEKTLYHGKYR